MIMEDRRVKEEQRRAEEQERERVKAEKRAAKVSRAESAQLPSADLAENCSIYELPYLFSLSVHNKSKCRGSKLCNFSF